MNPFDILPEVGLANILKSFYTNEIFINLSDKTSLVYLLESQELLHIGLPVDEYYGGIRYNKFLYVYSKTTLVIWNIECKSIHQIYPISDIKTITINDKYIFVLRGNNLVEIYTLQKLELVHHFDTITEFYNIKVYQNYLFIASSTETKIISSYLEGIKSGVLVYQLDALSDDEFQLIYLRTLSYDDYHIDRRSCPPTLFDIREINNEKYLVIASRVLVAYKIDSWDRINIYGEDFNDDDFDDYFGPLGIDTQNDLIVESVINNVGLINIIKNNEIIQEFTTKSKYEAFYNIFLIGDNLFVVSELGYALHYIQEDSLFILFRRIEFKGLKIRTVIRI